MKFKQFFVGIGAFAAVVAVVALANQAGIRNAIAQQAEQPATQIEQQDQQQLETQQQQRLQQQERHQLELREDERVEQDAQPGIRANDLIGMNVRGQAGDDNIGTIDDLMISHDGKVLYVAVSYGGFLGIGDRLVAVPMDSLEIVEREDGVFVDRSYARLNVTEEQLRQTEGFDRDNWPQHADARFQRDDQRHVERPGTDTDVTR